MNRKKATLSDFKLLGERQKWRCATCRQLLESTSHIDHRTPLWMGGSNDLDNLQILCVRCHAIKTQTEERARSHRPTLFATKRGLYCRLCRGYFSKYFRHSCGAAGGGG